MAKKLVHYDDVADAAQKIIANGKHPSVIGVRNLLKRGSFTTISGYLNQWFETNAPADTVLDVALPNSVVSEVESFVRTIYVSAKISADSQLQAERAELFQKELELEEEIIRTIAAAEFASERSELLEEQVQELSNKNTSLNNLLSIKTSQLDRSINDMAELEAKFQQAEQAKKELEDQVQELSNKNASLNNLLSIKTSQLDRSNNDVAELERKIKLTEEEKLGLLQKMADTEGDLRAQKDKNSDLTEKLRAANELNGELQGQVVVLQESLTTTKAYCESARSERDRLQAKLDTALEESRNMSKETGVMAGQLHEKELQTKALELKYGEALSKISRLMQDLADSGKGHKE